MCVWGGGVAAAAVEGGEGSMASWFGHIGIGGIGGAHLKLAEGAVVGPLGLAAKSLRLMCTMAWASFARKLDHLGGRACPRAPLDGDLHLGRRMESPRV